MEAGKRFYIYKPSHPILQVIRAHKRAGKTGTVTAVRQLGRFGALGVRGGAITRFEEKPTGWINGGYFVFKPDLLDAIRGDSVVLERGLIPELAAAGQLGAYRHPGFWQPMDTLRDKNLLEDLWKKGAPWKARW